MHKNGEKLAGQQKRIEELEAELARYRDLVSSSEPIESENSKYLKRLKEIETVSAMGYWDYYINADKFERSEKIFDIYERTPEEFPPTFSGFLKTLHPEDRLRIKEEFLSAQDSGEALRTEYRIIVKENKIKHLHLCCLIEKDSSGKAIRAYGTTQDVTESKIAEQELAESEARFRMVSDNSADGIALLEYGKYVYLSPVFLEFLDVEDADLSKLKIDDLMLRVHKEDRERVANHIREAIANKLKQHKYEYRLQKRDGSTIWIENSIVREYDEQGINCRTLINGRDITKQKALYEKLQKSEAELKENKGFLEETGKIAKIGGWSLDVETGEGYWTEAVYQIYGLDSSVIPTVENTSKFYPPDVQHVVQEAFDKAIQEGKPIDIELPVIDANGNKKWVQSIGRPEYENGVVTKIVGALQDITVRKELQLDLEATMKALPDMLFELDDKGTYINYYAPDESNLYVSPDNFIGKSMYDLLPAEAADIIKKGFENFIEHGRGERVLYSMTIDGAKRWFEMAIAEKTGYSHGDRRFICLVRNITDRINIENELMKSRELLRDAGRMAKVGGWSFEEGIDYVYWSEEVCRLFEVDPDYRPTLEEAINYWHPDYKHIIKKAVEELLQEGKSYDLELKIVTAKRNVRWLYTIGRPLYDGDRIIGGKGTVQDITERKQLEESVRISEERLRLAMEAADQGMWDYDVISGRLFFNKSWKKKVGFDENSEFIESEDWQEKVHPDDWESAVEAIRLYFEGKTKEYKQIIRVKLKDGKYRSILDQGKIIEYDENNSPIRMAGTHTDIDDRIEMESSLRESRLLLDEMGKMAKIGAWSLEAGSEKTKWTNEVYRIHEVDSDYIPTVKDGIKFYHPESMPLIKEAFENAVSKGESYELTLKFITAKGNVRWVHTLGNPTFENGKFVKITGTFQDITEKKMLEDKLQKSEERLRFAIESVGDGVWDWDLQTNQVYFSTTWKEMLGYKDNEIKSSFSEWDRLVHPDDIGNALADVDATISGKHNEYKNIHRLLCADGSYRWILSRGQVIEYNEEGRPSRMIGTHTDLTEQMETEEALRESELQLLELNRMKDKLFSIIGHDLKNPVFGIMGSTSTIVKKCENEDYAIIPRLARNAHKAAKSALSILEDLLNWSKVQSGKFEIIPEEVDLFETADNVVQTLKTAADKKDITIEIKIDPEMQLFADLQMLQTILRNLISNAIKFTHSGGNITVTAEEKNEAIEFRVEDTGIGIEQVRIRDLFRVGESVSTQGTENESGTGLGLILCKEFVEMHKGKIWVESTPGESTSVYFTIPV